ncbi:MAG: hypothetical protein LUG60_14040 [Erysipelotrichaceae bacterium]|nr:hypothetical protein [Erysipelotrichaceae bacterium]
MLDERFGNVSKNVNERIAEASFEQLGNAIKNVYFIQDQKEIIQYLIS